ncbi:MAG TPA: hypothetical protein VE344_09870 [Methylomirabilota bacterium]|nr:hypothetical protein [Methylomirabilota bacterium]
MNKRKEKLQAKIGAFMQQYARKSQRGQEPNDRSYSRKIEAKLKRMKPEELDELLNSEQDDLNTPLSKKIDDMSDQGVPRRGF